MELLKIHVETYTSKKMEVKQLIVVLRILLIDRARNQENWLEAGVLNSCAPASLPIWRLQNLINALSTSAFQISSK